MYREKYPKVLLLCDFNYKSPNGITINNLFREWPKNLIALACFNNTIEQAYTPNIRRYYCFGKKEFKYLWPFGLLKKINPTKVYLLDSEPTSKFFRSGGKGLLNRMNHRLVHLLITILDATGLSLITKKYKISGSFDKWVCDFDPDIIYTSMGDIRKMEFISQIKRKYSNKKIVIHIMDDYINSAHNYTILPFYWKKRLDNAFRNLLSISDLNLSISEKMSEEYLHKYGKVFYPFHNPIEPDIWLKYRNIKQFKKEKFTFIYTGKIDRDTSCPIKDFLHALKELNNKGQKTEFHIYAPYEKEVYRLLGEKALPYYKGFVKNKELPEIIKKADGLLLPLDFTKKSIRYTRLSISTKTTEYMISKIPIFVYAPRQIAVTEYLEKHQAAYIVDNKDNLQNCILEFIQNKEMRKQIANNAFNRAINYHTIDQVSESLRELLTSI